MTTNDDADTPTEQEAEVLSSEYSLLLRFGSTYSPVVKDELNVIEELTSAMNALRKVEIIHLETRMKTKEVTNPLNLGFDCLVVVKCGTAELDETERTLNLLPHLTSLQVFMNNPHAGWIPRHVSELDRCLHLSLKFQPELQTDHPGFHDMNYRQRREEIAQLAFSYQNGDPLPNVQYTEDEVRTWKTVYNKLRVVHVEKVCREYIEGLELLEKECGYSPDCIPQIDKVSKFLERTSGFRLRPVAGLVSPRDFLAHFAYRIFPCTQYVRHHSRPTHTPEPDCIHELLGHIPVLINRAFADFAQMLGLASLGASDEVVKRISTLFWFTIEFGLCMEAGQLKVVGAGIVSSFGELENVFSEGSVKRDFDPAEAALQLYDDVGFQPVYFVCQTIGSMKAFISEYLRKIPRSEKLVYDPVTQSIETRSLELHRNMLIKELEQKLKELECVNYPSFCQGMHFTSNS